MCSGDKSLRLQHDERMDEYLRFCASNYVPVYSQPWWMDAVCGDSWDVWLYKRGSAVEAAMPHYFENRARGLYITKAPLTQNNGIIFRDDSSMGRVARANYEARIITAADSWISSLGLAVYEQQFQTTFTNWLPFSWRGYHALARYTYAVTDTSDVGTMWSTMSSSCRNLVRKGQRSCVIHEGLSSQRFWEEHEKVFARQGLPVPFSRDLWERLYTASTERNLSRVLWADAGNGEVASLIFLVWDQRRMYHLLGGTMPGYSKLETYRALIWRAMQLASEMGLIYDFEGSMIERISKPFREFGGEPQLYFRIRKVFNRDIVREEAEAQIEAM